MSAKCIDDDDEWVMYKNRPEWADVVPVSQDDGLYPVVKIAYTEAFTDVYDYFRGIVAKGELSERALQLTEDAIQMNAANYTVWQYRHHRRVIVEWLNDACDELDLTDEIFKNDAKNYHAWEYRQWVLKTFRLFDGELEYVDKLLLDDVQNNSAWNQRYFVIANTTGFTENVIAQEIEYVKSALLKLLNNESPWSYLRGVISNSDKSLRLHSNVVSWCIKLYEDGARSPYFLSFLLDIYEDKLSRIESDRENTLKLALEVCSTLYTQYDRIREEYWKYRERKLNDKYSLFLDTE